MARLSRDRGVVNGDGSRFGAPGWRLLLLVSVSAVAHAGEWDNACAALSGAIATKSDLAPEAGVALSMRLAG